VSGKREERIIDLCKAMEGMELLAEVKGTPKKEWRNNR